MCILATVEHLMRTFVVHQRIVNWIETFSNDRMISNSWDNTIKVWHLDTGECLYTFINDTPITAIVISPDGKKVIAGDEAGRLHFLKLVV
jgi:WD40 repeat protein